MTTTGALDALNPPLSITIHQVKTHCTYTSTLICKLSRKHDTFFATSTIMPPQWPYSNPNPGIQGLRGQKFGDLEDKNKGTSALGLNPS